MSRFAQIKRNVAAQGELSEGFFQEIQNLNGELGGHSRILVRASGTEPVIRLLAEAETLAEAECLYGRIEALVQKELGRKSS